MDENKTTTVEMTAEEQAQFAAFKRDQDKSVKTVSQKRWIKVDFPVLTGPTIPIYIRPPVLLAISS